MGPFLVPFKEKSQLEDISLITKVNDEIRQDDRTSRMLFNIPKQINYISTFTTLMPGDIIITGTPTGAGARFDPPKFLKPGDKIEVSVEGVGSLINTVEDE
jgi:2-keto-4-pentenoate hydratase/2-oxohepta-3-ene-1,7-dioic acid hydratase in catechol pathway